MLVVPMNNFLTRNVMIGIDPAIASGSYNVALSLGHNKSLVRMAGLEPAISCSQGTRDARLPYTLSFSAETRSHRVRLERLTSDREGTVIRFSEN